jgi:hypothetical protein
MTIRQIIQEIEKLSPAERREVLALMQQHVKEVGPEYGASAAPAMRFMEVDAARPLIKEILTEHSELFRKLAQ